ncbi:MAG: hypothetical protein FJX72_08860, partial [Armatimonadetes bacterium]|nr:hypothetical protein [Armatimonadota bacterium]
MNQVLVALHALHEVDAAIIQAERLYRSLDTGAKEKEEYEHARAAHDQEAAILRHAEANKLDAELELKTVEEKKRDHEAKLYAGRGMSPKELDAMQHEVESLGRRRASLDGRILELMETSDQQARVVADLAATMERAQTEFATKSEAYTAEARRLRTAMARLQRARTERAVDVAPGLLKRYDVIRTAKHGIGLAP